ncbi:nucleotidyltransferase family protein [Fuscibacter oryzae]|uniref:Nucleotidyltransferase family protein n=1 Tax=Fuscibacter oryzae TaxID=2803939 RepID=A0A8J7SRK0_9RHOB|nr:nucleotidyltransferase family protein [Fuscibacter oryzae]MBL4927666.1 nucleotidyltransferase family protein [Fuscibacter oryzae]
MTLRPIPHILILAAGASSRMAPRDKLLEQIDGQPLIARSLRIALATGLPVTMALPPDRPDRWRAIEGMGGDRVTVERARDGMAESLKKGLAAIPPDAPVLLLLADLPELETADLLAVAGADPDFIQRGATQSGQPGHPVLLPAWLRPELNLLTGDEGARALFQRHKGQLRLVPLPDNRALTDLDTPEDWARWRALRHQ